jgi:2-polyprenyl-3-methyl-5-hydroxy-6-metoxy-1,4-benzoquinol methylase
MDSADRQAHWENVYGAKGEQEVSWFQERATISLDLIEATGVAKGASILDIGGGASRLVDALLDQGFASLTVLDLSEKALATTRARLGSKAANVRWIVADVTKWEPAETYDVWHDRAAFHFLMEPHDRAAYAERLRKAVCSGGHVIIGTFAPDGPQRCSGLPVMRHDAGSLGEMLGRSFELMESRQHDHQTPMGGVQRFQFSRFRRAA